MKNAKIKVPNIQKSCASKNGGQIQNGRVKLGQFFIVFITNYVSNTKFYKNTTVLLK